MKKDDEKKLKDGIKDEDELDYAKEPADDKAAEDPDKDDEPPVEESSDPKFDALSGFIDEVVNDNFEEADKHISEFIKLKARERVAAMLERKSEEAEETDADTDDDKDDGEKDYSHLLKNRAKKKAPLKKMRDVKEAAAVKTDEEKDDADNSEGYLSNRDKKKKPLKKMKKEVSEAVLVKVLKEFMSDESPIRLKGDDVFVNNKLVGSLKNDLSNADTGIVFQGAGEKGGKDFNNIQELYQFLVKKFEVNPDSALGKKDKER